MKKNNRKRKMKRSGWRIVLLAVLLILLAAAIWFAVLLSRSKIPEIPFVPSQQESQAAATDPAQQETDDPTEPLQTEATEPPVVLDDSFQITHMTGYAGIYMEDGSDEVVTNVMMIVVENLAGQDLQLARIDIAYPDFTAQFEVTNLPAGEKAVLLEKNRRAMPNGEYTSIESRDVAFFQTPMSLMEDTFEIRGGNGYLEIKNISDTEIRDKVYIYYKHASADLLYGGITFRAAVSETIAPGEIVRVLTNHYTKDNSRIMAVTCTG